MLRSSSSSIPSYQKSEIEKRGNGLVQAFVIANVHTVDARNRTKLVLLGIGGLVYQRFPQGFHYLFGVVVVPCLKLNARHVERHTVISEMRK